jgi:hypothetical protein
MDGGTLQAADSDFISLSGIFCKAIPTEEAGQRVLYLEASNETKDHQNEKILQSALADSKDFFLRHGNIDISHFTMIGLKHNIPNYLEYEIGKPREVGFQTGKTFVKAELYQGANGGSSAQARNADMVWDSLTKQQPPMSWFPSVGGGILDRGPGIDPQTKSRVMLVKKVRWCNIGLDRTPVNMTVPEVSLAPVGTFMKGMAALGTFSKTLTTGYGTDSAQLAGGAALRKQSLYGVPTNYFDFRDRLSKHLMDSRSQNLGAHELIDHSINVLQLDPASSTQWVERFMRDLHTSLTHRSLS